jgi:TetR/AcrR family transcriptional regulator, cholesterol catabolism regulator
LSDESVVIGNNGSGKTLIYRSSTIFERRRRIMHETRSMISESGYENFNVRELARRAGVAQRTLYNAFGSRENIIISAIYQYSDDFAEHAHYVNLGHTLLGRLERAIKVHSRNLQIRPYTTAVMAIYNSASSDRSIRHAISKMSDDSLRPFADHLLARRQLAADVTPQALCERITRFSYCTLSAWCLGEIADGDMVENICEAMFMVISVSTRGAVKREADDWLEHIRGRSAAWGKLRAASSAPPTPRRAVVNLRRVRHGPSPE